jgi:hypothetical protein
VTYIEGGCGRGEGSRQGLEGIASAAALGDTSKKAEADAKVAELESKVGGK